MKLDPEVCTMNGAVSQLLALERQHGIRARVGPLGAEQALLRDLSEQPLSAVLAKYSGHAPPSELRKIFRLRLSRHFLAQFWAARGPRLLGSARSLANVRPSSSAGDVLTAVQEHFSISDRALEHSQSEGLIASLAVALRSLFSQPPPGTPAELGPRLRALSIPLVASTWFAALDWQSEMVAGAYDRAWPNYNELLADVAEHYSSPAEHYRAGVEGYLTLLGSLTMQFANSIEWRASLGHFMHDTAQRVLTHFSRIHMLSLAALDEECRSSDDRVWRLDRTSSPCLEAHALERIAGRMHELAARSNTRGKVRLGCPFTALTGAFRDLHVGAFLPLADRWIFTSPGEG